ncbi:MAG: hypothetical protein ABIM89_16615 [Mycobacteriales bacterium]
MNAITAPTSARHPARRFGRPSGAIAATAAAIAIVGGQASPASAVVEVGAAWAHETVTCNSVNHTITLDVQTVGFGSGVYAGSDLFPYERQMPVYLKVSEFINGRWITLPTWRPVPGASHIVVHQSGVTYWYFHYAFQTPSGAFVYRNEYASGMGPHGGYSDQRGYRALNRCVS